MNELELTEEEARAEYKRLSRDRGRRARALHRAEAERKARALAGLPKRNQDFTVDGLYENY